MEKDVTEKLRTRRGVTTQNLLSPQAFYGGAIKWSPFYGKNAFLHRRIAFFDHYFTAGAGITIHGGLTVVTQDTPRQWFDEGLWRVAA